MREHGKLHHLFKYEVLTLKHYLTNSINLSQYLEGLGQTEGFIKDLMFALNCLRYSFHNEDIHHGNLWDGNGACGAVVATNGICSFRERREVF